MKAGSMYRPGEGGSRFGGIIRMLGDWTSDWDNWDLLSAISTVFFEVGWYPGKKRSVGVFRRVSGVSQRQS